MHRLYPILIPLALLAPASAASAAPIMAPLNACYASDGPAPAQRETISILASGFTPASHIDLSIDGQLQSSGQADILGSTAAKIPAPFQGIGQRPFTLTLQEHENPLNVVTATSQVTNLSVTLRPKRARPSRKVRFSGRGFTQAKPVYGHYVFGGKVRKTIRLSALPQLPCGVFHAHRRQIPVKHPATGTWLLQVDQQRRYARHPASNMQPVFIRVTRSVKTR